MRTAAMPVLWVAFGVFVAAAMYVLLQACGLVLAGYGTWHRIGFDYCGVRPVSPAAAEMQRTFMLIDVARQLELAVMQRKAFCLAQVTPAPQARPTPSTPQTPSSPQRAEAPRPASPQVAERSPYQPPATPAPATQFPQDKWSIRDLSLLNGCWKLGREVRRPVTARQDNPDLCLVIKALRLCLDAGGAGQAEARGEDCPQQGATSCQAPITSAFADDGTLRLTTKTTQCPPDGNWPKTTFTCRRVDDSAVTCSEPNGGGDLQLVRE